MNPSKTMKIFQTRDTSNHKHFNSPKQGQSQFYNQHTIYTHISHNVISRKPQSLQHIGRPPYNHTHIMRVKSASPPPHIVTVKSASPHISRRWSQHHRPPATEASISISISIYGEVSITALQTSRSGSIPIFVFIAITAKHTHIYHITINNLVSQNQTTVQNFFFSQIKLNNKIIKLFSIQINKKTIHKPNQ